ncbi:MAG: hypothetical protein AAF797_05615 [Planctomycetota bacterium]
MQRTTVIDRDFIEARAALLDVAAFLDRLDRAEGDDDFRATALRAATALLDDGHPDRVRRLLEHFSDPTTTLLDHAPSQGAAGAYDPASSV